MVTFSAGVFVMILITPPTALSPNRTLPLPRTISTRSIWSRGICVQSTPLRSISLTRRPSTSTRVLEGAVSPKPRRSTCALFPFPIRSLTTMPSSDRSRSATVLALEFSMSCSVMTVTFAGILRISSSFRVAVTTTSPRIGTSSFS